MSMLLEGVETIPVQAAQKIGKMIRSNNIHCRDDFYEKKELFKKKVTLVFPLGEFQAQVKLEWSLVMSPYKSPWRPARPRKNMECQNSAIGCKATSTPLGKCQNFVLFFFFLHLAVTCASSGVRQMPILGCVQAFVPWLGAIDPRCYNGFTLQYWASTFHFSKEKKKICCPDIPRLCAFAIQKRTLVVDTPQSVSADETPPAEKCYDSECQV